MLMKRGKKILIEFIFFIGVYVAIALIMLVTFPYGNTRLHNTIDINVHDTYFLISNVHVFIALLITGYFISYQTRNLTIKFKNRFSNIIGLISNVLFIILLSIIISLLFQLKNTAINNAPLDESSTIERYQNWFYLFIVLQIIPCLTMIISSYRIGKRKRDK